MNLTLICVFIALNYSEDAQTLFDDIEGAKVAVDVI